MRKSKYKVLYSYIYEKIIISANKLYTNFFIFYLKLVKNLLIISKQKTIYLLVLYQRFTRFSKKKGGYEYISPLCLLGRVFYTKLI